MIVPKSIILVVILGLFNWLSFSCLYNEEHCKEDVPKYERYNAMYVNGGYYVTKEEVKFWYTPAAEYCMGKGTKLATVKTQEDEQEAIEICQGTYPGTGAQCWTDSNDMFLATDSVVDMNYVKYLLCDNSLYNENDKYLCGECNECRVLGTPHIDTFYDVQYHPSASCGYILVDSCNDTHTQLPFSLSVTFGPCEDEELQCVEEVELDIYNTTSGKLLETIFIRPDYANAALNGSDLTENALRHIGDIGYKVTTNPEFAAQQIDLFILESDEYEKADVTLIMDGSNRVSNEIKIYMTDYWTDMITVCGLCGELFTKEHYWVDVDTNAISDINTATEDDVNKMNDFMHSYKKDNDSVCIDDNPMPKCKDYAEAQKICEDLNCTCPCDQKKFLESCIWEVCYYQEHGIDCYGNDVQQRLKDICEKECHIVVEGIPTGQPTPRPTDKPTYPPFECPSYIERCTDYVDYKSIKNSPLKGNKTKTIDNRMESIGVRTLLAIEGADPRTMEKPIMPFLGQIIHVLVDINETFDGWIDCDGRELVKTDYPELNLILGGDEPDPVWGKASSPQTFKTPDCRGRIIMSSNTESGIDRGYRGKNFAKTDSIIPKHRHTLNGFDSSCYPKAHFEVTLDNTICEPTAETFNNEQAIILLDVLIVAKNASLPSDDNKLPEDLIVGEIVFYAGIYFEDAFSETFLPCDSSEQSKDDFKLLYNVLKDVWPTKASHSSRFELPDCRNYALIDSDIIEADYTSGEDDAAEIKIKQKNIPEHIHKPDVKLDETCSIKLEMEPYGKEECVDLSNKQPWIKMQYLFYGDHNHNPKNGHFEGSISIFTFNEEMKGWIAPGSVISKEAHEDLSDIIASSTDINSTTFKLPSLEYKAAYTIDEGEIVGEIYGSDIIECKGLIIDHRHEVDIKCDTYSPTETPTSAPTNAPTGTPSQPPTRAPTNAPTGTPSQPPTRAPTNAPTGTPSQPPTRAPTNAPTGSPSQPPTRAPTNAPTGTPSQPPTRAPTNAPTGSPSQPPTRAPTNAPTGSPSQPPTRAPTNAPTGSPSQPPTRAPTNAPTGSPTQPPTRAPTNAPTGSPSQPPTRAPTNAPTGSPSQPPTRAPTNAPTGSPSQPPTRAPTNAPTGSPSQPPTRAPTNAPTGSPSQPPTNAPTNAPTGSPSQPPTRAPTNAPTGSPSQPPTNAPTNAPTGSPSQPPTRAPTNAPTGSPSQPPTRAPTNAPTGSPSQPPTRAPTNAPTGSPSQPPTRAPTNAPTGSPSQPPTRAPTNAPTGSPSQPPTRAPTNAPTGSPSQPPTRAPTNAPTGSPSQPPTRAPTNAPTGSPSQPPTNAPTNAPTGSPSQPPTRAPTNAPTGSPSQPPTRAPTNAPTGSPSQPPTRAPTNAPTASPTDYTPCPTVEKKCLISTAFATDGDEDLNICISDIYDPYYNHSINALFGNTIGPNLLKNGVIKAVLYGVEKKNKDSSCDTNEKHKVGVMEIEKIDDCKIKVRVRLEENCELKTFGMYLGEMDLPINENYELTDSIDSSLEDKKMNQFIIEIKEDKVEEFVADLEDALKAYYYFVRSTICCPASKLMNGYGNDE